MSVVFFMTSDEFFSNSFFTWIKLSFQGIKIDSSQHCLLFGFWSFVCHSSSPNFNKNEKYNILVYAKKKILKKLGNS